MENPSSFAATNWRVETMGSTLQVDGTSFETEVLNATTPVLVDFWAPWCGPCKMITPIVEELASDYDGRVKVVKVNVDNNQELAARFGIRGIPTVMIFKDGQVATSFVGLKSKADLAAAIDKIL
jgi:thioredoxin 1